VQGRALQKLKCKHSAETERQHAQRHKKANNEKSLIFRVTVSDEFKIVNKPC
jgi:glycine cleavage system regulatory protein